MASSCVKLKMISSHVLPSAQMLRVEIRGELKKARSNGSLMKRARGWGEGPAQEVKRVESINNSCLFRVCVVSGIYI